PTPPPKDTPVTQAQSLDGTETEEQIDVASYFTRRSHIARAASIYTLSRVSFTNQIQQLTSISLPPAASLSSSISAIPTSTAAGRALHDAAGQIRLWMTKASEVLNGLDAEDDVEWAAAAGREGLAEVDIAIGRFESLVNVYITAIEELQSRSDIASLPAKALEGLMGQMDEVVRDWNKIKKTLKEIKSQVEIAMEWEELWNIVLGEIGLEIENLSRLVFEMEERRHRAITESVSESAEKFDIAELETIVEETPRQIKTNNRFSLPPTFSVSSPISPIPQMEQESSKLLALFARMQPLRASLDFLPMRLASFQNRGAKVFPTACDDLNRRKEILEAQEKQLEADADALRQELGEDKWVHSFRQAGSKALAMWTSLTKSVQKVRQAIDEQDDEKLASRISAYNDKKEHYPPSMRRVLELIDIEMRNRSTVNGEILRIQQDVRQKVTESEREIQEMDAVLDYFNSNKALRDSVSTVFSSRTEMSGSAIDTPGSSPASSVINMSRKGSENGPHTPNVGRKSRQGSTASSVQSVSSNRRFSSLPTSVSAVSHIPRHSLGSRLESMSISPSRGSSHTPSVHSNTPRSDRSDGTKPRWNSSVNMNDTIVGHNFKPLSATTPSPHRKSPAMLRSMSTQSAIPVRSPLSQSTASPPTSKTPRPSSTTPSQRPSASKRTSYIQAPSTPSRVPATRTSSSSKLSASVTQSGRRVSPMPEAHDENGTVEESPTTRPKLARPSSSMNGRRASMLPQAKTRPTSERVVSTGGRESRVGGRMSSMGNNADADR
ncbi:karyogamy protein, partial [Mytilinidion resinicola]